MKARLSRRATTIGLLALMLAVAAAGWWFYAAPAREEVGVRSDELAEVTREVNGLQDVLVRMRAERPNAAARTLERLRLAKALPVDDQVPEALVQLQDLAARAGVELTSISATGSSMHGSLRGAQFELVVTGRFHDVDDFLYRVHNLVRLDAQRRPVVGGRLIALRALSIAPEAPAGDDGSGPRPRLATATPVRASLSVVAYVAPVDGSADAGPALAAPAPEGSVPEGPAPGGAEPQTPAAPDPAPAPDPGQVAGAAGAGEGQG